MTCDVWRFHKPLYQLRKSPMESQAALRVILSESDRPATSRRPSGSISNVLGRATSMTLIFINRF